MNIQQHTDRARQPRSGRQLSPLPPGTRAPGFTLRCGPHRVVTLDDFRGRPVVLVFYVADWHPVCGAQLALYQELLPELERHGAALVAISADSLWSHAAFARAHRLQFPLLADHPPRGAVARAYGVYDRPAGTCRRALFVVGGEGIIRWSADFPAAVNPGADGILTALETLAAAAGRVTAPASVVELPRGPPRALPARAGGHSGHQAGWAGSIGARSGRVRRCRPVPHQSGSGARCRLVGGWLGTPSLPLRGRVH